MLAGLHPEPVCGAAGGPRQQVRAHQRCHRDGRPHAPDKKLWPGSLTPLNKNFWWAAWYPWINTTDKRHYNISKDKIYGRLIPLTKCYGRTASCPWTKPTGWRPYCIPLIKSMAGQHYSPEQMPCTDGLKPLIRKLETETRTNGSYTPWRNASLRRKRGQS